MTFFSGSLWEQYSILQAEAGMPKVNLFFPLLQVTIQLSAIITQI